MSELKKMEQQLNMKFIVKLEKSGAKINEMLRTVHGEDLLKPAMVYKWVKCFLEGGENHRCYIRRMD